MGSERDQAFLTRTNPVPLRKPLFLFKMMIDTKTMKKIAMTAAMKTMCGSLCALIPLNIFDLICCHPYPPKI